MTFFYIVLGYFGLALLAFAGSVWIGLKLYVRPLEAREKERVQQLVEVQTAEAERLSRTLHRVRGPDNGGLCGFSDGDSAEGQCSQGRDHGKSRAHGRFLCWGRISTESVPAVCPIVAVSAKLT